MLNLRVHSVPYSGPHTQELRVCYLSHFLLLLVQPLELLDHALLRHLALHLAREADARLPDDKRSRGAHQLSEAAEVEQEYEW